MKYMLVIVFFIAGVYPVSAQEDPVAEKILNHLSEKTKASEPFHVTFLFTAINLRDKSKSSYTGELTLEGKKYHLKTGDSEIFFDGHTVWNYLPDANEVNVLNPDPEDHSFLTHPEQLFSDYRLTFRYHYVGINKIGGQEIQVIDLYPVNLKEGYSRIRLQIDRAKHTLHSARYFGKNGMQYVVVVKKTESLKKIKASAFKFHKEDFPDVEVIDLRDSK